MYQIFIWNCSLFQIFSYATKLTFTYLFTRNFSLSSIHIIWHSSYILLNIVKPVDGNFQSTFPCYTRIFMVDILNDYYFFCVCLMTKLPDGSHNTISKENNVWGAWTLQWILSQLWVCKYCTGHYLQCQKH
jgi:hypothetical protein